MGSRHAAALGRSDMQEQGGAGVNEVAEQAEVRTGLVVVLFAELMEIVDSGGEIVTAGRFRRQEVRSLQQRVFVIALLRRADAAERRRPAAETGAEVAQQRTFDLVAEWRAAADNREVLFAPLRFEEQIAGEDAVVMQGVKADRI